MKKSTFLFLIIFMMINIFGMSQKVTLKMMDASTLQSIEKVSVKSYLNPSIIIISDSYGHVTIDLIENDTLLISKDYYHPIYLFVKARNFDTIHVVSINLLPSKEIHEVLKTNFSSLSDFEYHFIHDQIGDESFLKVKGFEHLSSSEVRSNLMHSKKNPNGFHISPSIHQKHTGENQYFIKK